MKIKEDLELIPTDIDFPEEMLTNYLFRTSDDFVIVDDWSGLMKELGFNSSGELADYLDERYGDNWGDNESWTDCSYCGKAIYLDDYYRHDYAVINESGFYCSECIKNVPSVRDDYLEDLTNNDSACNEFLSESELEDAGLIKLENEQYEYGYFGRRDNPKDILDRLLRKYPNGKFVFDEQGNQYNIVYTVWAYPGYEEGAIEDEEE